jgi:hypothetical protein
MKSKQTTQTTTAPPYEVHIYAQRIFCPPWPQFFRRKNISVGTKARLLAMPIVLTVLITNMTHLAILTLGGVSTHSPSVLQPSRPNLEPAAAFKNLLAQRSAVRLILQTSLIKGRTPSIRTSANHRMLSGDNLVLLVLMLMLRGPRRSSPSSVTADTAGFTKL